MYGNVQDNPVVTCWIPFRNLYDWVCCIFYSNHLNIGINHSSSHHSIFCKDELLSMLVMIKVELAFSTQNYMWSIGTSIWSYLFSALALHQVENKSRWLSTCSPLCAVPERVAAGDWPNRMNDIVKGILIVFSPQLCS